MKCPTCTDTLLVMTERQGVEIDYCPQCRGVWLDRGELDKLLEKAAQQAPQLAPPPAAPQTAYRPESRGDYREGHRHDDDYRSRGYKDYRRKSWLSDIFD